jgi:hypothetical protein
MKQRQGLSVAGDIVMISLEKKVSKCIMRISVTISANLKKSLCLNILEEVYQSKIDIVR